MNVSTFILGIINRKGITIFCSVFSSVKYAKHRIFVELLYREMKKKKIIGRMGENFLIQSINEGNNREAIHLSVAHHHGFKIRDWLNPCSI